MSLKSDLSVRMKEYYENIFKTKLMRRTPVVIRLDGKAFHTFTRGMSRPFDEVLSKSMRDTMKYLCENIQGCVIGYTQSDEITLVLVDYKNLNTSAWFDYEVQKMCSISASMATFAFNRFFEENFYDWFSDNSDNLKLVKVYREAIQKGAMFDTRVFNIPKEEVANMLFWRQDDAIKNSIQMVAQCKYSHKELQGISTRRLKEKLYKDFNIDWDSYPTKYKRGSCCIKNDGSWFVDTEIPIFKDLGRGYIEKLIFVGE